jgi:hypothetical protein
MAPGEVGTRPWGRSTQVAVYHGEVRPEKKAELSSPGLFSSQARSLQKTCAGGGRQVGKGTLFLRGMGCRFTKRTG